MARQIIPAELQEVIERSVAQVRAHPQRRLRPFYRSAIYAAILVPRSTLGGRLRRVRLDVLAAQRALPLWQQWRDQYRPTDYRLERVLAQAEHALRDAAVARQVGAEAQRAWDWLMSDAFGAHEGERPSARAVCSAFAAGVQAAFTAVELTLDPVDQGADQDADTGAGAEEDEDEDVIDPWNADVVLWVFDAEFPYAHGTLVEHERFWVWWLTSAVPAAWAAASEGC